MKLYYPAIFIEYNGEYTVEFPDLPGCVTQGESFDEAYEMAEDAACGWILSSIEDNEEVPSPSDRNAVNPAEGFVNYVALDIDAYSRQYGTKTVKKTLSIPEWLNVLAERQNVNFSQELKNALIIRVGLTLEQTQSAQITR